MVAVLHNIRSLHNVGSIFRTADGAGIEKIYLCGITPTPIDRIGNPRSQISKVALGAEKFMPWEKMKSTTRCIKKLREEGYKILAIEQNAKSVPYRKIKPTGNQKTRTAIIVGNEINGLPKPILKQADEILEIPMRGKLIKQSNHPRRRREGKESLNVSVAFGIIIFHLLQ